MSEALDAIRARKLAAEDLTRACSAHICVVVVAFAGALAEPIPETLRKLTAEAERRLTQ